MELVCALLLELEQQSVEPKRLVLLELVCRIEYDDMVVEFHGQFLENLLVDNLFFLKIALVLDFFVKI